jgi:hypothetical protein
MVATSVLQSWACLAVLAAAIPQGGYHSSSPTTVPVPASVKAEEAAIAVATVLEALVLTAKNRRALGATGGVRVPATSSIVDSPAVYTPPASSKSAEAAAIAVATALEGLVLPIKSRRALGATTSSKLPIKSGLPIVESNVSATDTGSLATATGSGVTQSEGASKPVGKPTAFPTGGPVSGRPIPSSVLSEIAKSHPTGHWEPPSQDPPRSAPAGAPTTFITKRPPAPAGAPSGKHFWPARRLSSSRGL